jgi:hypothetical protein
LAAAAEPARGSRVPIAETRSDPAASRLLPSRALSGKVESGFPSENATTQ